MAVRAERGCDDDPSAVTVLNDITDEGHRDPPTEVVRRWRQLERRTARQLRDRFR
jgi:hypothetical protein